jgi:hypothetical protein
MSASVITRRVAIFTVFVSSAWMAAAAGASALVPDPPAAGTHPSTHTMPATTGGSGLDLTAWLLAAFAVAIVVVVAAWVATALHRRRLQAPTQAVH